MKSDRAIFDLLEAEKDRQSNGIELIASENFTSPEVMKACGSILTNKYRKSEFLQDCFEAVSITNKGAE